jgi:RND family efflux transporter MFP subunit
MESTQIQVPPVAKRQRVEPHDGFEPIAPAIPPNGAAVADHDQIDLDVPPAKPIWVITAAVIGIVLLLSLLFIGLIPRQRDANALDASALAAMNAPVPVNVILPRRAQEVMKISMPANLRPWQEVSIFSRTTGYLKKFYVDISEHVTAGQLMAEIDTPEVDQQLKQAQAALLQTQAAVNRAISDRDLAQVTYERYQQLAASHSATAQDVDTKKSTLAVDEANLQSAKANVAAAEANVQRLLQMQSFEKVVAPFSGVISGRGYDVGSLILADPTNVDSMKPMFKIAQNDVLRVFVNVPQSSALTIRKGMQVDVTARELPGQTFVGTVMGTTNYLDQTNRSLLTEVKVLNVKGADGEFALLPGMYVTVNFVVKRGTPPLVIPSPALVTNSDGTQVAIVQNGQAHFVKVVLGQDFGNEVEVVEGLKGDERIIANPGERIVEGVAVDGGPEKAVALK